MSKRVLITGGAGFIGSFLCDELLAHGYRVRVLDNLEPQVHGETGGAWPQYLNSDVEPLQGDVRDRDAVNRALSGVDVVFHLAAMVGVGQSMYEMERYESVNGVGTATLLECLVERRVERLIVASSMSIYGEGRYVGEDGSINDSVARDPAAVRRHEWEPVDSEDRLLKPVPTPESKVPSLSSVYALGKYNQERMCLMAGEAYGIPTVALRFFNVYGPRQALSNPYTGVMAIFASRLLNGKPPLIFEDGNQQRDFVSVHDVGRACRLTMQCAEAPGRVFNIGSGRSRTIRELAETLGATLNRPDLEPGITGNYRVGDIRHCFADIDLAERLLGYKPRVTLRDGVAELAEWLEGQTAEDRVDQMNRELAARGLSV